VHVGRYGISSAAIKTLGAAIKQLKSKEHTCGAGHKETVELLLKRRASPFMEDRKGENALAKTSDDSIKCATQSGMRARFERSM
jgi:hypothetical protein